MAMVRGRHPGRRPARRKQAAPRSRDLPSRWPSFFTGLALGLVVAGAVWMQGRPPAETTRALAGATEAGTHPSAPDSPGAHAESGVKKPHFEFYTILPEMEVQVPDDQLAPRSQAQAHAQAHGATAEAPAGQREAAHPGADYVLQVGSFRTMGQADRLKASLALLGLRADIQSVAVNSNETWYRVRLGPYTDLDKLNAARKRLRANGMDAMVLRIKS